MTGKTVLVLGGGVGGITAANMLRKELRAEDRVVVVDKRADYIFTPSLLWVMVGWRRPEVIVKPLRRLIRPTVELVIAEAKAIDLDGQLVKTSSGDLAYDYLVISTGADLAPEMMPGFAEAAYTPYDLHGAVSLYSALERFEGGRVAVVVTGMPYKCPAAPYETAMLLDDYLRRNGLRDQCEVAVYTPEILPMGVAGPAMGKAVVDMLSARGIDFHPELKLSHIDPAAKEMIFTNRDPAAFELLAGVPPHRPPSLVSESSFANESGWLPVNRRTLQTADENVYAIGDTAAVTLANGMALPKAGVFADGQALIVAQRIASQVRGLRPESEFDGLGFCWIETGGGSAGFASGEFYAEPDPMVPLPRSGRIWHWGKILFEKYWLGEGLTRQLSKLGLDLGGKALGVHVRL